MSEHVAGSEPFHDLHRIQSVWTEYAKLALKHGGVEEAKEVLSRGAAGLKSLETYTGEDMIIQRLLVSKGGIYLLSKVGGIAMFNDLEENR